nr:hypothetical protein [Corynebacterium capitovis]
MNQIVQALTMASPTPEAILADAVTFSPRRWKTGWPHHLRHVPPFRDDATATISRGEVFLFAADAVQTEFSRDAVIDFIGAAFAFGAGSKPQVQLKLQQFLRNKSNAAELLRTLRTLPSKDPAQQVADLEALGLDAQFASTLAYFLAGTQEGAEPKPVIVSPSHLAAAGLTGDTSYAEYLAALSVARDEWDATAPLDAVEFALSRS